MVNWAVDLVNYLRGRTVYPGLPFVFVPAVLASLIAAQFSTGLSHYPGDQVGQISLRTRVAVETETTVGGTLLVVPEPREFFLRGSGNGVASVFLSMSPDRVDSNVGGILLRDGGLDLGRLKGVGYPLVILVEGDHADEIDLVGQDPQRLADLQLSTPLSNWVVFFLLAGAVFGFGASTGFLENRPVTEG